MDPEIINGRSQDDKVKDDLQTIPRQYNND